MTGQLQRAGLPADLTAFLADAVIEPVTQGKELAAEPIEPQEPSADYRAGFEAARRELALLLARPEIVGTQNRRAVAAELWANAALDSAGVVEFIGEHIAPAPQSATEHPAGPDAGSRDHLAGAFLWH